jgi:hypothetical protein
VNAPTNDDDDDIVLPRNEQVILDEFRENLSLCKNEDEKFEVCIRYRDNMLAENTKLQFLAARIERVISTECNEFWKKRCFGSKKAKKSDAEAANWEKFVGIAREGDREMDKCLPPLRTIISVWGKEIVQHYQFAMRGERHCIDMRTTALKVRNLEEFLTKTGQVQKRRLQITGKRLLRPSINPIDPVDLMNVRKWESTGSYVKIKDPANVELPYERITIQDVPEDFGLDKYGLIVHRNFAIEVKASDQIRDNPAISSNPVNSEAGNFNPPRLEYQQAIPASVPESTSTPFVESEHDTDTLNQSALSSDITISNSRIDEHDGSISHCSDVVEDSEHGSSENPDVENTTIRSQSDEKTKDDAPKNNNPSDCIKGGGDNEEQSADDSGIDVDQGITIEPEKQQSRSSKQLCATSQSSKLPPQRISRQIQRFSGFTSPTRSLRRQSTQESNAAIQKECECNTEELETLQHAVERGYNYNSNSLVENCGAYADKFCENHLRQFATLVTKVVTRSQDSRSLSDTTVIIPHRRRGIELNLVDKLRTIYDDVLNDFHSEVKSCLESFEGQEIIWKNHLEQMNSLLTNIRWAQISTQPDSHLGKGSVSMDDADVYYFTPSEFQLLIKKSIAIRKCVVIRESWDDISNQGKIPTFLQHLQRMFSTATLEVQDISSGNKGTNRLRCSEYVETIQERLGKKLSNESLPLNLLNLKAKAVPNKDSFEDIIPADLARFNLLDVICERGEGALKSMDLDEHRRTSNLPPSYAGKAKYPPTIYRRVIDMQSCRTFGLFALRGSFSGWHVDVLNGTYVSCVAGLKAWLIHQYPLTPAEKAAFAKDGPDWEPDPSRVRLILLRPGDTLYMPAGELVPHAPITVTDCLMRGGMLWDSLRIRDILSNILWITENNKATNESIPEQLIICWPELAKMVRNEPDSVELASEQPGRNNTTESLLTFFDNLTTHMKAALSCECGRCKDDKSCRCLKNLASSHRCNVWCHPDAKGGTLRHCMT